MAIDQSKEINAVSAAVEAFRKATIAADKSTLDKLTANELSYGHSSGRLETKAQFIESLTSGKSGFSAIELSDQTITIVDHHLRRERVDVHWGDAFDQVNFASGRGSQRRPVGWHQQTL